MGLIFFSSAVDFTVGKFLKNETRQSHRKAALLVSLLVNLGTLGFFKYYNFFIENFQQVFVLFGKTLEPATLQILLPVGISFYTFQTLSYTIDVYLKKIEPTNNGLAFFAFVSFFPQLVAGPIERASNLLPQFLNSRTFKYHKATTGLKLIVIGLFKKMVIADNCALVVNEIFSNYQNHSGSTLLMGAVFFAFQIYGDFSGYSDIAIGTAKLLGFDLMKNFNLPYLSRNLREFWSRWHISLSTWFRDYVYIPLGGNRGSKTQVIRNLFIVFLLSGLWHGANWTFVIWGFIHAVFIILPILFNRQTNYNHVANLGRVFPTLTTAFSIAGTFLIVTLAWVFFRAETVTHALLYLQGIANRSLFTMPAVSKGFLLVLLGYMCVEWVQRDKKHLLIMPCIPYKPLRIFIYYLLVFCILYFAADAQPFIYFQF
ncbi:MBOAT family O-acyltransferase [Bizionia sediminis]|uniref:MBOAT family O-acyltransferase n=1 Tax=Bizionia sediminis TaxID=1737064 RepID=UPI00366A8552